MKNIVVNCYVVMKDCGDGSQNCTIVANEAIAIKEIGFKDKEDMEENYLCFYENGGYKKVKIELESEPDGTYVISKGFYHLGQVIEL